MKAILKKFAFFFQSDPGMGTPGKGYLYLLSFLEGGAVMACELIGAKMLAPYFGTSLYVWAAALGLTLGGLMCGYFIGGRLSVKYPRNSHLLFIILISAGFFLALMPLTSRWVMSTTLDLALQTGAVLSLLIFMFPPLIFMGMVSPLIIGLLTIRAEAAGNYAGNVYAISTLGGILFTFGMGFYVIPTFGITVPSYVIGVGLGILPLTSMIKQRRWFSGIFILGFAMIPLWEGYTRGKSHPEYQVLYRSEGILGQLKVVDHPSYEFTVDARMGRGLIVNNTIQSYVSLDADMEYSIWEWSHYFPAAASIFPRGSQALLLGLGGGTVLKQLRRLGFEVDVVELDPRIREVAIEYFKVDPSTRVAIDDARHYIRTHSKKYDIIVFDTFLSESVPEHLLTREAMRDVQQILKSPGMLIINFYGFTTGRLGLAARSVYKTLLYSGFHTHVLPTPGSESTRNLIFLASTAPLDFRGHSFEEPGKEPIRDLESYFIQDLDTNSTYLLTDQVPRLAKLYAPAAMLWRKGYNAYFRKYFSGE